MKEAQRAYRPSLIVVAIAFLLCIGFIAARRLIDVADSK